MPGDLVVVRASRIPSAAQRPPCPSGVEAHPGSPTTTTTTSPGSCSRRTPPIYYRIWSHQKRITRPIMRFSATTLLITALAWFSTVTAHNIQLRAHSRECFHESLHKDDKMTVSFQVGDREFGGSGNLEIDFWVGSLNSILAVNLRADFGVV